MSIAWTDQGTETDRLTLFIERMRRNWKLAAGLVAASVVAAAILAFVLPSYWRVEIVVMPVSKNGSPSLNIGSLPGGIGSLGALLGRPSSNEDEALAVLRSRELFDNYATKQNLLPILFASKWDADAKHWTVPASRIPTLRQGFKLFDKNIRDIDVDRRSGIVTMGVTWKDRDLAAKWARGLIDLVNSQLRQRAVAEAQQNMTYLSGEMRNAQATGANNALDVAMAAAYERQLQDYMFAKGQREFAFRIIDPPTIPDDRERVWPKRWLLLALGLIGGCVLAVGAVHLREAIEARRSRQTRIGPSVLAGST